MEELSLEDRITKASLDQVYKNAKIGTSGLFIMFVFVAFFLMDKVPTSTLIIGSVFHILILSWRVYKIYKYRKVEESVYNIKDIEYWLNSYRNNSFLIGVAWGLLFFFLNDIGVEHQLVVYIIIAGLATAGLFTLGSVLSIYLSFMVPILGITFVWMLIHGDLIYLVLSLLLAIWALYTYVMALKFAQNFRDLIVEKEKNKSYTQELKNTNEELKEIEERMELALIGNNDGLWDWNLLDNSVYLSRRWKEMIGFGDKKSMDQFFNLQERVHPDDIEKVASDIQANIDGETEYYENVHRLKHKDGHWVWILDRGKTHYDENGKAVRMIGTHTDITEEKKMELKYAQQAQIIQQVHDSVISTTLYGIITSWNIGSELLLGYKAQDMIGKHITTIYNEVDHRLLRECMEKSIEKGEFSTEIHLVKKSNKEVSVELTLSLLKDEKGENNGIICYAKDITERKQAQAKLRYQAHYDSLTDLPNRTLFNDRLKQGIEKAKRNGLNLALLFIDLDRFKQINDSLGHDVGDFVLKIAASRLKSTLRKEDTLARLGGDEFTIIMEELIKEKDASLLAQKILDVLDEPIYIEGRTLYISSSIGISIYPQDSIHSDDLLKYADVAMYKAKNEGRNNFQYYSYEMTELVFERVVMEANIREAVKNSEFVVYYQPQIDANRKKLIGMEALVRWKHPTLGLVFPSKFISLSEETGLVIDIDHFMMQTAMAQVKRWYDEGLNPGVLALNITVKQLERDDFLQTLQECLDRFEFKPEWLELEITESEVMQKLEDSIVKLQKISDLGVRVAVDDFGTGYSSLSYIKRLPIDKLKIDQEFVKDVPDNEEDSAIVKAIIAMAQSLNLDMIAEGVETKTQKDFLLANGCDNIQGHYYSRAIPTDEMKEYLFDEMKPSPMDEKIDLLLKKSRLYSREEIIKNPSLIPSQNGFYVWFFRNLPMPLPFENSFERDGFTLSYLGSIPARSSSNSHLRKSIVTQHLKGNAHNSTLRLSLACLLKDKLDISLLQHGNRIFLGDDEEKLDDWLNKNARVAYLVDEEPWVDKVEIIKELDLPLNLEYNRQHPFYATLKTLRLDAKKDAKNSV